MLTTVEDLILYLCDPFNGIDHSRIVPRDKSVLFSFAAQIRKNLAFTERQANLALKILDRNRESYVSIDGFTRLLDNPIYKNTFRIVDSSKTISIVKVNDSEFISVKFPFNHRISNSLNFIHKKVYDRNLKSFLIQINEQNITKIVEFGKNEFDIEDRLISYYNAIKNIKENPNNYLPCLDYNSGLEIKNISQPVKKYFDTNSNGNLLHDVFLSKLMGFHLTESCVSQIKNLDVDPVSKAIILDKNRRFAIKNYNNIDISNALANFGHWPIMLVMTDDKNSTEVLNQWTHSLKNIGVESQEMSVLFRSQTDKSFNDFVKNNSLNNLVTADTKVVFIKYKTPKVLYRINFQPKIVISTSTFYVHFTNQRTIDYHPLVMYYTNQNTPTGSKIAKL